MSMLPIEALSLEIGSLLDAGMMTSIISYNPCKTLVIEEKYSDSWPLLGALPKVYISLMFHPAGLQVLIHCNLTRSTLVNFRSGLPTIAPGRPWGLNAYEYR